jgi:hypothetical protein
MRVKELIRRIDSDYRKSNFSEGQPLDPIFQSVREETLRLIKGACEDNSNLYPSFPEYNGCRIYQGQIEKESDGMWYVRFEVQLVDNQPYYTSGWEIKFSNIVSLRGISICKTSLQFVAMQILYENQRSRSPNPFEAYWSKDNLPGRLAELRQVVVSSANRVYTFTSPTQLSRGSQVTVPGADLTLPVYFEDTYRLPNFSR